MNENVIQICQGSLTPADRAFFAEHGIEVREVPHQVHSSAILRGHQNSPLEEIEIPIEGLED